MTLEVPTHDPDRSYWVQLVEFAMAIGQAYPEPRGFITGDWSVEYPPIAEQPPSYGGWSGYVACT